MSSKTSNLNLYSSDNLSEKALHVVSVDAKLSMTSPNVFELNAPSFSLQGQTTPAHDIGDLGLYLKTLSDLQGSDSTTQSAAISSNTTSISVLDAREASNHAAQAALLGAETARATTAETNNSSAISAESTRALAAEAVNASAVVSEANARDAADVVLQSNINAEKSRLDALLAGANINLDTFVEIANAFASADTSILTTISALDARVATAEAQIADLTN